MVAIIMLESGNDISSSGMYRTFEAGLYVFS